MSLISCYSDVSIDLGLLESCAPEELDANRRGTGLTVAPRSAELARDRLTRLGNYLRLAYHEAPSLNPRNLRKFYRLLSKNVENWDPTRISSHILRKISPELDRLYIQRSQVDVFLLTIARREKLRRGNFENQKRAIQREINFITAQLAEEFGVTPRPIGSGVNGACFARDFNGRPLWVMKSQGVDTRPAWKTEKIIGERTQPEVCQNDPRQAGAVVSIADQFFGFGIVPHTRTDSRGYSYQEFVNSLDATKARSGSERKLLKDRTLFSHSELVLLQLKAILNSFTGDLDQKIDKLRYVVDERRMIVSIYETDNDNTFPNAPLTSKDLQILKKNEWKEHHWAQIPFVPSEKIDEVLSKLFDPRKIQMFISEVSRVYPNFWEGEHRIRLMYERIATIKMCIEFGYTPFQLGVIYGREVLEHPDFSQEKARVDAIILELTS